jgi:cyclin H
MKLTEDDLYRQSSQYKHWSFTPTGLALLRQKTNIQACERVKANVARQRAQRTAKAFEGGGGNSASDSERANTPGVDTAANGNGNGGANGGGDTRVDREVKCLSVAEEMRLVDKFCETTLDLATFLGAPSDVTVSSPIHPPCYAVYPPSYSPTSRKDGYNTSG